MTLRTLSLALVSAVTLAACGSDNSDAPATSNAAALSSISSAASSMAAESSEMMSSSDMAVSSETMSSDMMSSSSSMPAMGLDCDTYTAEKGAALYSSKSCVLCHGAFDESATAPGNPAFGTDAFSADATMFNYLTTSSDDLASFISANMPPPTGDACDEDCGINLAVYISSLTDTPLCSAPMAEYSVSLINGSAMQTLSPAAVILSDDALNLWSIGSPASSALEMLAESGSPAMLLEQNPGIYGATLAAVPAGQNSAVTITAMIDHPAMLSVASMPIFTNDAIVGLQNIAIHGLAIGDSMILNADILDAGTEANTETLDTVPGLGMEGAGYLSNRDELTGNDAVTMHPGVVSNAELSTSALSETYRFDSGSFMIKIVRNQ